MRLSSHTSYMAVVTLLHLEPYLINLINEKLFLNANSPLITTAVCWSEEVCAAHKGSILHENLWRELGLQPQRGPGWGWGGLSTL